MNATDTTTYQARLRARRAELASLRSDDRRRLAGAATDRSARRWRDGDARPDQQRRASLLRVVPAPG
jgi:hypothetical protein